MAHVQQTKDYKDKMSKVQKEVNKAIENMFKSDTFKRYLEVVAAFPKYSFNNVMMIVSQKPDATMVQGYKAWQKYGRQVQKGEKGLKIFAPTFKKMEMTKLDPKTQKPMTDNKGNEITEKKEVLTGFRLVNVFDVSQTKGKELVTARDFIKGDLQESDRIKDLYVKLMDHLNQNTKFNAKEEDLGDPSLGGYYRPADDSIRVNAQEKNTSMKFKTLIHEYAHGQLHHKESDMKDLPRGHKEAQAEAVAFSVSKYYGLNTDQYSAGYIAHWSRDINLARQALSEIQQVASRTIHEVDGLMKDRIKEFQNTNQKEGSQDREQEPSQKSDHKKEAALER